MEKQNSRKGSAAGADKRGKAERTRSIGDKPNKSISLGKFKISSTLGLPL